MRGVVLCLASAAAFGVAPVLVRGAAAAGVDLPSMLGIRFAIAAAIFWVIALVRRSAVPRGRVLVTCVGLGAIGYALQSLLYFGAVTRIDVTLAGLLLYSYPALVVGLAVLLRRERAERTTVLALACSLAGLGLLLGGGGVEGGGGPTPVLGVLMALGAALTYALYITVASGVLAAIDTYVLSALVCTAAAAVITTSAGLSGQLAMPSAEGMAWITAFAVVGTAVAVACFFGGVRVVGASRAAVLSCAEPVVTALTGVVLYAEALTLPRMLGGAAVLGAVLIVQGRRAPVGGRSRRRGAIASLASRRAVAAPPAPRERPGEEQGAGPPTEPAGIR